MAGSGPPEPLLIRPAPSPYDPDVTPDPRVDAYLAALPPEHRILLEDLRQRVAALAPEAVETISYGMPTFKVGDRFLLSYAGWKDHCSLYGLDAARAGASHGYKGTKGTLHFSPAQPLADDLLHDLVERRLAARRAGRGEVRSRAG